MKINNVIVHKLIKEIHGSASIEVRDIVLDVDDNVTKFVIDIHNLYASKAGKGYGRFDEDEVTYPTSSILRSWVADEAGDFVTASKQLMKILSEKASLVPLATGGYVLMAHVTNDAGVQWFVVAIINNVEGNAIDEKTFEIKRAIHVDLKSLRVAGRVNISEWLAGETEINYIGFLKQRGDNVASYFKVFLGCNDLVVNTVETKKLVGAVKKFARDEKLDDKAEVEFLRRVNDYCIQAHSNDTQLSLEALANYAWPDEPEKLTSVFSKEGIEISDGFVPDKRSLRSLTTIQGKSNYWKIDLQREALTSGEATYDSKNKQLILKKLPQNLIDELEDELNVKAE